MKNTVIFAIITIASLLTASACKFTAAKTKPTNPVDNLVSLCQEGDYSEAGKHMLYDGPDARKTGQRVNYEKDDDQARERVLTKCKRFTLMDEKGYKVISIAINQENEKPIYQYNVDVTRNGETIREKWFFDERDGYDVLLNVD